MNVRTPNCGNYGILLPQFFLRIPSNQRLTKELKKICVAVNFSFLSLCTLQCGNFMIFLQLRFYVNSISRVLGVKEMPFF